MDNVSESTRVRVAVRIRPIGLVDTTARGLKKIVVHAADEHTLIVDDEQKGQRQYKFDNVFLDDQATVFAAIGRPMLHETFKGFNVCLFAYGQTGSGKTYSILGDMTKESSTGLTPRLVHDLFSEAQQLVEKDTDLCIKISMSMTEIYMEKVRDLLAPRTRGHEPETLDIREDAVHRVYVKGISRHPILSYERTIELLKMGNANRQIAETLMNETSSRSHAIIQINVLQEYGSIVKKDLESTITLVDLAGSERQGKTESTEHHFEEAKKINHSLLMLGRALNAFSERKTADAFISLRESKLTRLLSESFGGNSKTWMLATVAPTLYSLGETLSTLDYARNAMAITNVVHVNDMFKNLEKKQLKLSVTQLEEKLTQLLSVKEVKEVELKQSMETCLALQRSVDSMRVHDVTASDMLEAIYALKLRNIALRRRVEAASHKLLAPLDNEAAPSYFKGRGGVSIAHLANGEECKVSIALITDTGVDTGAELHVKLLPLCGAGNDLPTSTNVLDSVFGFTLEVVGASSIPKEFSMHSFCVFFLRNDSANCRFTTSTCADTVSPRWNCAKQFVLPKSAMDLTSSSINKNLFSFEVFGLSI